jgi:LacI family transcriptional regulator
MKNADRANIKQIAKEAGVSTQTVSRVINNRHDVAADTRKRIQEIIERLGYQPNHHARSLIHGRSCTIGIVTYGLKFFGPSRTFLGIEAAADELGYTLFLRIVYQPENNQVEYLMKDMLAHQVDGIVWAVPEIGGNRDWLIKEHCKFSIPLISLSMESRPGMSVIAVDNFSGGYQATQHLIQQGYRKVGIITGPLTWWEAQQRLEGWRKANQDAGRNVDESFMVEGDWTPISGEMSMYKLLQQRPDIDGVFICNDHMSIGAMKAARQSFRNIPNDLGIVGFDDISETPYFVPPLSTLRQDMRGLGIKAMDALNKMIKDKEKGKSIETISTLLEPQLIVRQSSSLEDNMSQDRRLDNL